jgi:acetyl-CoA carboxylase biotin carboxylase subunit
VPIDYDPLLAKLAVWAGGRGEAIARMLRALDEYYVAGIKTNLAFFRRLLEDEDFAAGRLHTGFVEEVLAKRRASRPEDDPDLTAVAALVGAVAAPDFGGASGAEHKPASRWRAAGWRDQLR